MISENMRGTALPLRDVKSPRHSPAETDVMLPAKRVVLEKSKFFAGIEQEAQCSLLQPIDAQAGQACARSSKDLGTCGGKRLVIYMSCLR